MSIQDGAGHAGNDLQDSQSSFSFLANELAPNAHLMPSVCQVSGSRNKQSQ